MHLCCEAIERKFSFNITSWFQRLPLNQRSFCHYNSNFLGLLFCLFLFFKGFIYKKRSNILYMSKSSSKVRSEKTKMPATSSSSKVSLKLLIDKKVQKVLFAEGNKEFVDFLFYILSLRVGTVIKLLTKNSMVGSLGNLYNSVENLNDTYIQPNQSKDSILNPKIADYRTHVPLLLPCYDVPMARKFYTCSRPSQTSFGHSFDFRIPPGDEVSGDHFNISDDPTTLCPQCNGPMNKEVTYVVGAGAAKLAADGGGFVKGVVTYMIMDDLVVKPMSTISCITMLNQFNVKEIGDLEEKVVSFDMKEGLVLLKASLECKNVLTTVFLA